MTGSWGCRVPISPWRLRLTRSDRVRRCVSPAAARGAPSEVRLIRNHRDALAALDRFDALPLRVQKAGERDFKALALGEQVTHFGDRDLVLVQARGDLLQALIAGFEGQFGRLGGSVEPVVSVDPVVSVGPVA